MSELNTNQKIYVLIDYENIQPKTFPSPEDENINILVFVGKSQEKINFNTVMALQLIGKRARYIKINTSGNNAVDFHIAYYIGLIAGVNKTACFHIISNDTGFDPLIAHLKTTGITCTRSADFPGCQKPAEIMEKSLEAKVIAHLQKIKKAAPGTEEKLRNMLLAVFKSDISLQEITPLIETLKTKKIIQIRENKKVSYSL